MKTHFNIEADTGTMIVTLRISQGSKLRWQKQFATVTDAAQFLLHHLAELQEKQIAEKIAKAESVLVKDRFSWDDGIGKQQAGAPSREDGKQ